MIPPAMKPFHSLLAVFLATVGLVARAALTESVTQEVNRPIPDVPESGTGDIITYTNGILGVVPGSAWKGVMVRLQTAGGYNGDLYVLLEHGTNFAVLLNRPGRTATRDNGYGDAGLDVVLDDDALNGDIHLYRNVLNPLGGTLTGRWRPDARDVDPELALDTDPRTAPLSGMVVGSPDGEWSLTVIDSAVGDEATLVSWGLEFSYTAPAEVAVHDVTGASPLEVSSGQVAPVDFGVTGGGVPVFRDFRVSNVGNDALDVSNVSVPAGFRLVDAPTFPVRLAAGANLRFSAVLTAASGGSFTGDVVVSTSDSDEGTFRIPVAGIVDGNAPTITACAAPLTLVQSGPDGVALPDLTASVSATDVEPGALTFRQSPAAGTLLTSGVTSVAVTVSDAAGNESLCLVAVTVVRLPSAGADFGETVNDVPTAFRVDRLLANDTDPDGASLSLTAVEATSARGGSVTLSAGVVGYTPPAAYVGTDTFRYTLTAGGRTVQGTVTIRVRASSQIPVNLVFLRPAAAPASGMDLRFVGLPGRPYSVQFSADLSGPWTELARVAATAGSGFVDHAHAAAPSESGFYRCLPAQ